MPKKRKPSLYSLFNDENEVQTPHYVRSLEELGLTKIELKKEERERFQKAFGENIQWLRKKRGMNQREMALYMGVSVDSVSSLERGKIFVSRESVLKLAHAFEMEVYELFIFPDRQDAIPKYVSIMQLVKEAPLDVQKMLEKQIRLTLATIKEAREGEEKITSYSLRF